MPVFTSIRESGRPPSKTKFNFEFCEMSKRCWRVDASYSTRNSTGSLHCGSKGKSDAIDDAAKDAAAEAEIMEPADVSDEMGEGQANVGSGALAAQSRSKAAREKEKEEFERKLKALEAENSALKKVVHCSFMVWHIS